MNIEENSMEQAIQAAGDKLGCACLDLSLFCLFLVLVDVSLSLAVSLLAAQEGTAILSNFF